MHLTARESGPVFQDRRYHYEIPRDVFSPVRAGFSLAKSGGPRGGWSRLEHTALEMPGESSMMRSNPTDTSSI